MQTDENIRTKDEIFLDTPEYEMYSDTKGKSNDYFFSLTVIQITACLLMTAILFIMSFFGSFKEKTREAVDYFQSFELTPEDISDEVAAMKGFLSDDKV